MSAQIFNCTLPTKEQAAANIGLSMLIAAKGKAADYLNLSPTLSYEEREY
jgi:hypothetical protein